MELVYLWVEEYKNIKKQGFNFSPRFECEFKDEYEKFIDKDGKEKERLKKDCELIIKEKKDYVCIFPDNINVTAIVGGNGSGKSSLLNAITNEGVVIYKNKKFLANKKYKIIDKVSKVLDFDNEFFTIHTNSDLMKINHIKNAWDAYRLNMYDENVYIPKNDSPIFTNKINIKAFEISIIKLINKYTNSFHNNLFHFNPIRLKLSFYTLIIPNDLINNQYKGEKRIKLHNIKEETKNIRDSSRNIYEKLLAFLFTKMAFSTTKLNDCYFKRKNILDMEDLIKQDYSAILQEEDILKAKELFKLLEEKNVFDCSFIINDFFDDLEKIKCTNIFFKLIEIDFLRINFIDKEKEMVKYFDLSQGERKFFNEFLMIFDKIKETDKKDILIALDEPDLSLHPEWQKKYLQNLLKLLEEFPKKKFHIIITSHSPFILSDLPKENVIFLEKGKQVYPFENNQQTFGANIHTLLSHGFFMKDGLMGEFAKTKINKIIENLNDKEYNPLKEDKKKLLSTINVIGEDFLKMKLLDMYYRKFDDDYIKKERKKELIIEKKKIENELKNL